MTTITGQSIHCKVCGNLRTDGQPHCHQTHERDNTMKMAQSTEEITRKGRTNDKPNPFLETATLDQFKTGNTFRIDLEPNDKPYSIVTQMREAAKSVGMSVTYRTDEDKKLTEVSSFLVKFITPRKREGAEEEAAEEAAAPTATASKRK